MTRGSKLAVLAAVAAITIASPPARSALKAVGLILDVLPSPFRPLRAITPDPRVSTVTLGGTSADIVAPRGFSPAPGIVLVHGATTSGKDDPRLRDVAHALARSGRRVVIPQLGLRNQRLDVQDEERIRDAVEFAAGDSTAGVLAFSYGAALCLVALAEESELQMRVDFVATVGTYFDLTNLIQGVTTGTVLYKGRRIPWRPHPRAKELLPQQLAAFLDTEERKAFLSALERQEPAGLSDGPLAAYQLVSNRDPDRVEALQAALPAEVKRTIDALSPAEVVDRINFPVYALHSTNDPASPSTESKSLVQALEPRVDARLYEVSFLQHVDPTKSIFGNLREAFRIIRFTAAILRSQEGWARL